MDQMRTPFDSLLVALDAGDMAALRAAVRGLDAEGQELLAQRLGGDEVARLRRCVRRSRETERRASGGRVIVIHGIMGALLDVVDPDGDSDRVWLNYWRLFNGRIADLKLDEQGGPADPRKMVRVAGLFPEYLSLVMELDRRWKVRPFAFDWREDIDRSVQQLARTILTWARGEPCHIVAHSMGGLVARRLATRFPNVWRSMRDPTDGRRGGRLIQLGTPNRGSLVIPMVFTGAEGIVRKLALLDRKHRLDELLPILSTFPGSYQMMPAPGSGPDDRDRLYEPDTWGDAPAHPALLDLGRRFQDEMAPVVDPERLVYVAGYDQDTPYRIRVKGAGRFEYQMTRNGDGRVPHELGLLDDVRTQWVDEAHGDLPRNQAVLAGIHELLAFGMTASLHQTLPVSRSRAPKGWVEALPPDPSEAEVAALVEHVGGTRGHEPRELSAEDAQRLEAMTLRGFVGSGRDAPLRGGGALSPRAPAVPAPDTPPELAVEVICGDVSRVPGDAYAVGHYIGALPQAAEAALDAVISGQDVEPEDRVLHALTRRGVLRGELGDIDLYPWADGSGRLVAVAGMGHPGTFARSELRKLGHDLTLALTALPNVREVCSVLIGSGTGNLPVTDAVEGLLMGAADALREKRPTNDVTTLRLVELDFAKAQEIQVALARLAARDDLGKVLKLRLKSKVRVHASARQHWRLAISLALAGLASATQARKNSRRAKAVDHVLEALPGGARGRRAAREELEELAQGAVSAGEIEELAGRLTIGVRPADADPRSAGTAPQRAATRFSCVRDDDQLRVAALSDTAVVPQRSLRFDLRLFEELARNASDPEADRALELGALIGRLLIPHDFAPYLRRAPALITELGRYTAGLPWELISLDEGPGGTAEPLALRIPFARQLRTAYSPAPVTPPAVGRSLRALVIGDPGDPREGADLPGARREAIAIHRFLESRGVDVVARIGAPSAPRHGELRDFEPAGRLDVLELLLSGRFDLVHYCGHGDFDPDHADRVGWVFEGGLLTAREIERLERAPRLIVANACLSGRTSARLERGGAAWRQGDDARLVPTLADELFKRGVRDYIGTAWEISDEGAICFAETLYGALLAPDGPATLGDALLACRQELHRQSTSYDALWAAYQHYGDPQQRILADA